MRESARTRWYVNRIGAAFEAARKAGGETYQPFVDVARAIKVYGRWPMLFAVEDALAESFWGNERTPPVLAEGEVAEEDESPEWTWLNRRMIAALSMFDDGDPDFAPRESVANVAFAMMRARGELGVWSLLKAAEELAGLLIRDARHSKPPEGSEGVRE